MSNLSAGTYAITETSAPDGYTIDNAGPDYVVLPNNGETTVTKVFTDTPTVTVKGSIRKVDRDNPSKGLAGATIAIQGVDNSFYGEYQTGAGGALEGLTWSSLTPGSYRAWEVSAPEIIITVFPFSSAMVWSAYCSTLSPRLRYTTMPTFRN